MRDPKPCPFCGAQLQYVELVCKLLPGPLTMRLWRHNKNGCFLDMMEISPDEIQSWNQRDGI